VLAFEHERRLHRPRQHRRRAEQAAHGSVATLVLNGTVNADRSPEQRSSRDVCGDPRNHITLDRHG
jgi:hypothetical protein